MSSTGVFMYIYLWDENCVAASLVKNGGSSIHMHLIVVSVFMNYLFSFGQILVWDFLEFASF